jgi:hypothetical protein
MAKRPQVELIPSGDPFVAFRRAYRAGTLRDLGGGRFEVPLRHAPKGAVVYEVDPKSGRPLRLVLSTDQPAINSRPAVRSRTVLRFSLYERLAVTAANRKRLELLPHPGPGTQKAREVFAALREGVPPSGETADRARKMARRMPKQFKIDIDGLRALADDVHLLPGDGYVCLAIAGTNGDSANCRPIRTAARNGIWLGSLTSLVIVVPDGVKAVQARADKQQPWRRYAIANGMLRLPNMHYRWRLLR